MVKISKNISIEEDVWKKARAVGLNISKSCEEHLKRLTSPQFDLLEKITTCRFCQELKAPNDILMFAVSDSNKAVDVDNSMKNHQVKYFACKDCVRKIKSNELKSKEPDIKLIKLCLEKEEEDRMKPRSYSEIEGEGDQPFTPFADVISVFDGSGYSKFAELNDIKHFMEEVMVDEALAGWKIENGGVRVHYRDLGVEYDENEEVIFRDQDGNIEK